MKAWVQELSNLSYLYLLFINSTQTKTSGSNNWEGMEVNGLNKKKKKEAIAYVFSTE